MLVVKSWMGKNETISGVQLIISGPTLLEASVGRRHILGLGDVG
jgi:hypothetical protein